MADVNTNLTSAVRAPIVVLAPASEFVSISGGPNDGMPQAWKRRMGTQWLGINGTFGSLTKASLTYLGERGETMSGAPGKLRSLHWLKPGYGLELEMHWDRSQIGLRKGDRFTAWVDTGEGSSTPALVNFHVEDISGDMGDEDTVTRKVTAEHRVGLDDITSLIRAEVDGFGAVIRYDETPTRFTAAGTDPALAVPSGAPYSANWTRTTTTATVVALLHGLSTSDVVVVSGSSDTAAITNGNKTITVIDEDTFTFTCLDAGAASGTLTITPPL